MNRYQNGKIYKLVNTVDDKIYVGSTSMPLSKRKSNHKADAKTRTSYVYQHLNGIGWGNVRIIQIEEFKCDNKQQLLTREQHYIDELKPELNRQSAIADCPHGRQQSRCIPCNGVGICVHNRRKNQCIECMGLSICIHKRQKIRCIPCGGSQICVHKRRKSECSKCNPYYCESCDKTMVKRSSRYHNKTMKHIINFIKY